MTPTNVDTSQIKVDTVYVASQFERINVTLEFVKDGLESFRKEVQDHDSEISALQHDMISVKNSIESIDKGQIEIKESLKRPKIHPVSLWGGILGSAVSGIALVTFLVLAVLK